MLSLYFHIPFCERKCLYCDFYSIESQSGMQAFVDALCREMDILAEAGQQPDVSTLFLGGGTPSLLTPSQLEQIFDALHRHWRVLPDAEVTLETNPGTVDREKLRSYHALGVNRLSIGIQSFDEHELHFLSRIHDSAQGVQCVEDARSAGFDNVSIDLIYSLPGQTEGRWLATLKRALALEPDHVSAYSLIVEENTPLVRLVRSGEVTPNPPEAEADLYERTMEVMAAGGYKHYEVSNYARDGFACRHNLAYWHHSTYLGFGPSAHSFILGTDGCSGRRRANIANLSTYHQAIGEGRLPLAFEETIGNAGMVRERIFLGLRADGLDIGALERELHFTFQAPAQEILHGLVTDRLAVREGTVLRLTDKGYLLCDEIAGRLVP